MRKAIDYFNALIDAVADEIVERNTPKVIPEKKTVSIDKYVPKNSVESAIRALANSALESSSELYGYYCCNDIYEVLKANWNDISDFTKSYAITWLRAISKDMYSDYYVKKVNDIIVQIVTEKIN